MIGNLARDGFAIVPQVFGTDEIKGLINALSRIPAISGVRTRGGVYAVRNLLTASATIRDLADSRKLQSISDAALGSGSFAIRGTLFDKTPGANWLVPWHQDLTICVQARIDLPGYGPWTRKAGVDHVQPPTAILEQIISVRIHLDDCDESNGALKVLPGTHSLGRLTAEEIATHRKSKTSVTCSVRSGDIVLMRPLLLHASSPASRAAHRRVIHLDFTCANLPDGLQWAN